ncbi:uncharacterized protein LOC114244236 [Bombyx mandarina]|uniref:Uncharacterized protein LOC114244236 n=1 Tax=Bombyx mandarina TaxID=7092 RepID=A0A6J2JQD6_BOMMA|nr:uncharacterized protein LOC114244236 [Bombyx mandarina]
MDSLDVPPKYPPPPPPQRPVRPKITLQMPDSIIPITPMTARSQGTGSVYWDPKFHVKPPGTPGSHISDPHGHFNPFMHMYHNKASEFMFKQFEGFKDFTMNTAKSGLSAGEKTAFWVYNKLKLLSRRWFTHLFLSMCLALYSVMGAAIFVTLERSHELSSLKNLSEVRYTIAKKLQTTIIQNSTVIQDSTLDFLKTIEVDLKEYEDNYTECMKHLNNKEKKTWTFWNAMFYAGTIYTTIGN